MSKTPEDPGRLTLENGMDLLLTLLYAPGKTGQAGEPINGITRLQKLMFLLTQGVCPGVLVQEAPQYSYQPYRMGPYSHELRADLEEVQSGGLVVTKRLDYLLTDDSDLPDEGERDFDSPSRHTRRVESLVYSLSDFGNQVGQELWESLTPEQQDALSRFKGLFNRISLRQLLIFVYERFPDFTTESTIKEQLGLG